MAKEKNDIEQALATSNVSTFAILDRLSDIEELLDRKIDTQDDELSFIKIEKTYKQLKEQLFESFYTSSDIEDIIIDPQHRHHELVMRLYHEYMDEASFIEFDNIEQAQEISETYFYFNDPGTIRAMNSSICDKMGTYTRDLDENLAEPITVLHSSMAVNEIHNQENKIESLIAIVSDLLETHHISYKTVERFLDVTSLQEYQDKLYFILSSYALKEKKYKRKLKKLDLKLNEYLQTYKKEQRLFAEDKMVLAFKRKGAKIKNKMLISMHNTFRDLDLIHERLYTFYHHLVECLQTT